VKISKSNENTEPYFSILTVSRNAERTIADTLNGIRQQTFKNFEFIVVDGESTDKTLHILKSNLDLINVLISEKDDGLYDAMNKGIKQCRGKYIGIINSDDIYEQDALEKIHSLAISLDRPSIIYGPMKILGAEKVVDISHEDLIRKMIPHPSCFVPREFYSRFGAFDTNFYVASDYELMLRFRSKNLPFVKISDSLVRYREGGFSSRNMKISIFETLQIQKRYSGKPFLGIYPRFIFILLKTYARNYINSLKLGITN